MISLLFNPFIITNFLKKGLDIYYVNIPKKIKKNSFI